MEKTIWFPWLQGIDHAPAVVKACLGSWTMMNPGWKVRFVEWPALPSLFPDDEALRDRIAHCGMLGEAVASDLIRVNLLHRYGGVWADATCLCRKPLDLWLPMLAAQGFFAFSAPAPDRILSSWFLAARRGNPIVAGWCRSVMHYWAGNPPRSLVSIDDLETDPRYREHRRNRGLWFDQFRPEYRSQCPYFWPHYAFEQMLANDADLAAQWNLVPKMTAAIPHRLQDHGLHKPVDPAFRNEFSNGIAPVFKLTHKTALSAEDRSTVFGYCLDPANW